LYHATDEAKSVMVIGGGFLGSELAVALAEKGLFLNSLYLIIIIYSRFSCNF